MKTKYLAPEFSIPYGSDGLQAVIKLWEIFYGELTISKGELYDRAIWQCSIDDIATIVLRPGGPAAIYEFPFLISAYLPDINEITRGWDTEKSQFSNRLFKASQRILRLDQDVDREGVVVGSHSKDPRI